MYTVCYKHAYGRTMNECARAVFVFARNRATVLDVPAQIGLVHSALYIDDDDDDDESVNSQVSNNNNKYISNIQISISMSPQRGVCLYIFLYIHNTYTHISVQMPTHISMHPSAYH